VSPAWSPDGSVIAYTRFDRGTEELDTCERYRQGTLGPVLSCVEERTEWPITRTVVSVIPVTGGEFVDLMEGADPTWSPDGKWVYVASEDAIWRIAATGGVFVRIAGTEGGMEPAVSPDGADLAFTRLDEAGKGDIWVVALP
jgi:Tol biopolymer transport system component